MAEQQGNGQHGGTDEALRRERNLEAVERTVALARRGATALVAVGAVALLGWLWGVVRTQTELSPYGFPLAEYSDVGPFERLDFLTQSLSNLVYATGAIALGLFLRAVCDHVVAAAGGSLPRVRPPAPPTWE